MKAIKVSVASTSARWAQIDANLAKIRNAAERAAAEQARLLLLPECCLTGADWPTSAKTPCVEDVALELGSPPMRELGRIARRTKLVLAVGLYERNRGNVYVTQALVGPKGMLGAYRKVHEGRQSSRDRQLFPVFDLGFVRVGISICRDNMLPECARILALRGAELLLAPFTSLPLSRAAWRLERLVALRARAQDNRLFVLSVSHAQPHVPGRPPEWGYSGICCAIDPLGRMIGESRGRVGRRQHLTVSLDPALQRQCFPGDEPTLRARRPGAYRDLVDEQLQKACLRSAPAFQYDRAADRAQ
ncbi:MAG TPA: carbon-nitrogen hydrolase family protein [Phycisphaerae bacterium]|nr:carbon-nitrogen hydrolase family protein [Phycisphaerae bacterium]